MCSARQQFFSGSGFAVDHHRRIGGAHGADHVKNVSHLPADADDIMKGIFASDLIFQLAEFTRHLALTDRLVQHKGQFFIIKRFDKIIRHSLFQSLYSGLDRSVGGHNNKRRRFPNIAHFVVKLQTVHSGHLQV